MLPPNYTPIPSPPRSIDWSAECPVPRWRWVRQLLALLMLRSRLHMWEAEYPDEPIVRRGGHLATPLTISPR